MVSSQTAVMTSPSPHAAGSFAFVDQFVGGWMAGTPFSLRTAAAAGVEGGTGTGPGRGGLHGTGHRVARWRDEKQRGVGERQGLGRLVGDAFTHPWKRCSRTQHKLQPMPLLPPLLPRPWLLHFPPLTCVRVPSLQT